MDGEEGIWFILNIEHRAGITLFGLDHGNGATKNMTLVNVCAGKGGAMIFDLHDAWNDMNRAQHDFNSEWMSKVVAAQVWVLPIKATAQSSNAITPIMLEGQEAIEASSRAMAQFEKEETQHPGTVMRLPGWIGVHTSVLASARAANRARQSFLDLLDTETQKSNLKTMSKGKYARTVLKVQVVLKQIERRIQVFDGTPRRILFTWAGNTAAPEMVALSTVIEKLQMQLEDAVRAEDLPKEQQRRMELRALSGLSQDAVMHRYRPIAPHPRVMLYFGEGARYDAMPHANLPIFVVMDEKAPWPRVDGLGTFDPEKARRLRSDKATRQPVIPRLDLYLQTDRESGNGEVGHGTALPLDSTYNQKT
ncbi:hypothetical protein BLL42_26975 (plasmid) [Pseudomonas frederiksbergensis]|uniref:Uncharacterized protein n=1 Tax=Pseudomonas frederiksbergensis TaxID=104087 RepID=A0A1J0ETT5_9PSED|nr:DNA replication terminus site-binding protein [Pseudomonas frederiksbergensis]APC19387.1 hypothetical protein BLL42_26975 [Pseudomonas frederiksbergensis]